MFAVGATKSDDVVKWPFAVEDTGELRHSGVSDIRGGTQRQQFGPGGCPAHADAVGRDVKGASFERVFGSLCGFGSESKQC